MCLLLEAVARLRELSDDTREMTGLIMDVSANGQLDHPQNADFLTTLEELHQLSGQFLEAQKELQ